MAMSDYMEIINPQLMTGKLYYDGDVIDEYKVELCDKCGQIYKLDGLGYQKSDPAENIIWFCQRCR
jgi:hypothetical protein